MKQIQVVVRAGLEPEIGPPDCGSDTLTTRPLMAYRDSNSRPPGLCSWTYANLQPRVLRLLGQRWVAGDPPLTEKPENSGLEIGRTRAARGSSLCATQAPLVYTIPKTTSIDSPISSCATYIYLSSFISTNYPFQQAKATLGATGCFFFS